MHILSKTVLSGLLLSVPYQGMAATSEQTFIFEIDPFKPIAAANEEKTQEGVSFSSWSGRVDFNIQNIFTTGPEFWVGNYTRRGIELANDQPRREDLWLGEKQKLSATRFRWNFSKWEVPESMRGWSITAGYDYLRIDSKANRYTDGPAGALPVGAPIDAPQDENDLVTDTRHGFHFGVGERWIIGSKLTITLRVSMGIASKRTVSVTSRDPKAEETYQVLMDTLANFPGSSKSFPEANMSFGYAL